MRFRPMNKAGEAVEPVTVRLSRCAPGNVYLSAYTHLSPDEAERVAAALVRHAKAARNKAERG